MGLEQYIRAGANLQRQTISLTTNSDRSGSASLGSAYTLLNISTDAPCRLRLYDNLQSLQDATEQNRAFGNTNISASIALIGDISMSAAGTYTIDPVLYAVTQNQSLTYYRISAQTGVFPTLTFTRYLLEDAAVSTSNRVTVGPISHTLAGGARITGSLTSAQVPRTYLLVSASLPTGTARLRLYSTNAPLSSSTELNRAFSVEPAVNTPLIVDAILSNTETTYFVPKIVGANLQTMGTDLNSLRFNKTAIQGTDNLYYVLSNETGGSVSFSISLHLFSLED